MLNITFEIIRQGKLMSNKYDVICTNPPYMGSRGMDRKLNKYIQKNYSNEKSDLFSAFIKQGFKFSKENGFNSMVTMQSWMFLSSFEKMRRNILENHCIISMTHMDNMVMGIGIWDISYNI